MIATLKKSVMAIAVVAALGFAGTAAAYPGFYCETPLGTFPLIAPLPAGSSCFVPLPGGTAWGFVV